MSKPSDRGEQLLALRNLQIPKCDVRKLSSVVCKSIMRCIDDHGSTCWASQAKIASEANTSVRSVIKALDHLEDLGLISKKVDRSHKTDTYVIVWERVRYATVADMKEQSGMQLEQSGMQLESISYATVADKARRSVIETRKKRDFRATVVAASDSQLSEWITFWNGLKAQNLVSSGASLKPSKGVIAGWKRVARAKELQELLSDKAAIERQIRLSEFCRGAWFSLEKLLGATNKSGAYIVQVLMAGGYIQSSGKTKTVNQGPGVNFDPNRNMANVKF